MSNTIAHTVCIDGHTNRVPAITLHLDGSMFFGSDYNFCMTCGKPNDRSLVTYTKEEATNETPEATSFEDASMGDLFTALTELLDPVAANHFIGTPVTDTQIKLGRSATIALIKRLAMLENKVAQLTPPF